MNTNDALKTENPPIVGVALTDLLALHVGDRNCIGCECVGVGNNYPEEASRLHGVSEKRGFCFDMNDDYKDRVESLISALPEPLIREWRFYFTGRQVPAIVCQESTDTSRSSSHTRHECFPDNSRG
jgi:hypothetical protein